MLTLISPPMELATLAADHANNNLNAPETIERKQNAPINGNNNWAAFSVGKYRAKGLNAGSSKSCSGAVRTPKKGMTAPILSASANEDSAIKNANAQS